MNILQRLLIKDSYSFPVKKHKHKFLTVLLVLGILIAFIVVKYGKDISIAATGYGLYRLYSRSKWKVRVKR